MKKLLLFVSVMFLFAATSFAQISVSGSVGVDGTYTSLTNASGAFFAINGTAQTGATILITITADVTIEAGTYSLNAGAWSTLTINPSGARTISGTVAGLAMINLNGANNVTINGLNASGNSLTISNLSTAATAGTSTIRFIADASGNTVTNCTVLGATTAPVATVAGTILFSTGTTTGNDNNTISNNNIADASAGLPSQAITSSGTSTIISNDNNSITGNNIYNWFLAGGGYGINVIANSSAWTISNNKLYQTASRALTAGTNYLKCISIVTASGGGYTISNNTIGYANASGTGMLAGTVGRFTGIELTAAASPVSNIQGNTINNVNWSTSSGAVTAGASPFNGIVVLAGGVNVGTTAGNTIGNMSGVGTSSAGIYVATTTTATGIFPIYVTSATGCSIQNNNIGAFSTGGTATMGYSFYGIYVAGAGSHTVTNNTIGNSTANSIAIGTSGTTTAATIVIGIYSSATGTTETFGSTTGTGNLLQNISSFGSSTTSQFYGISAAGAAGTVNMNYNTFTANTLAGGGSVAATIYYTTLINSGAATTAININNNTINSGTISAATYAGSAGFIYNLGGASTSALSISNNNLGGFSYTGATGGTGSFSCIYAATGTPLSDVISNNNLNNLSIKTTGAINLIYNSYAAPANGTKTVQGNTVVTGFSRTATAAGTFYCYYDAGASPSTVTETISGNTFSNITTNASGAYSFYGIYCSSTNNPVRSIYNNTVSTVSFNGTSSVYGFYLTGLGGTAVSPDLIYGNTFSGLTSSGTASIYGMYIGSTSLYVNAYNNTIQTFTLSGASSFYGIYGAGTSNVNNFYNNTVTGITNSAAGTIYGIYTTGGTTMNYYQNYINTLSSAGAVTGILVSSGTTVNVYQHRPVGGNNYGIYGLSTSSATLAATGITVNGGTTVNVYKNNIYNISNSSAGTTAVMVNGILMSAGTTVNTYNNTIGNLTASTGAYTDAIRGISVTSTATTANYNVYYNTVNLSGSGGANFGTSGIYHAASTTATTAKLDLRNNIIVNNCTPSSGGLAVAFRRSSGIANTLANYASTSNYNLFYAGTPGASNLIYSDGTSTATTLALYQAGVFTAGTIAPRDAFSVSQNPTWVSTTGSAATYLHIDPTVTTPIESGGSNIATYTDDIDGNTRQGNAGYSGTGTAPDIGADEFDGIPSYTCGTPAPGNTLTTANNLCLGQSITLSLQNAATGTGNSYQWQSSPDGITYGNISNATSSSLTLTPLASLYYQCIVTCQNGPVSVTSNPLQITFAGSITSTTPASRCGTGTVSLAAAGSGGTIKWYSAASGGASIGSGSPWTTPSISQTTTYYVASENSTPLLTALGAGSGTNTTTTYPAAYGSYWGNARAQYLILASELTNAGFSAGNFSSLAFDVTALGSPTALTGYTITIGATAASTITTFQTLTSPTVVYGPTNYTPVIGTYASNTHTFTSPYTWNGTSNIIVEVCFNNGVTGSTNALTRMSTTSYSSSVYYGTDGVVSGGVCANATVSGTALSRPNMQFNGYSTCSGPRSAVIATVNTAPALTVTPSQTTCNNSIATLAVTSNLPDFDSYIWSPQTALFTDAGCTSPYTGASANTVYYQTVTAGATAYTCNASNSLTLCANVTSTTVTNVPGTVTATASPASLCISGTSTLTGSPATGYGTGTFQWRNSPDNISFSDISGATTLTYIATLTSTTYYKLQVKVSGTICSESSATVSVNNPSVTGTTPGSRCGTGTVSLAAAVSPGSTATWYTAASGGSSAGSGSPWTTPSISQTTTYYVSASVGGGTFNGARLAPATTTNTTPTSYGLVFDVTTPFTLNSVDVYSAGASGTMVIQLQNSSGTVLYTSGTFTVPTGTGVTPYTAALGWQVALGTSYRLLVTSGTASLVRESSLGGFPYALGSAGSVTSGYIGGTSTTYYFMYNWSISTGCETSRQPVVATVTAAPVVTALATPSAICSGSSTTLSASSSNPDYTYTWSPTTTPSTGASVSASPLATGTYTVTATDISGGAFAGCTATTTVGVTVNTTPAAVTVTPSSATIAAGTIQQLAATGGAIPGSCTFGVAVTTNATTGYPAPYTNYYGGAKHQMLIRASELTNAGLVAGQITSIKFHVTAVGSSFSGSLLNFQIDMANTATTVLTSSSFISGLTNVLAASTVPITVGDITHTLTTPFTWDGSSNIVIQTSYSNTNTGSSSTYVQMTYSDPGFVSTNYYYADGVSAATILAYATPTSSGNARPNIILGGATAGVFTWSPTTELYTDAGASSAYSGTAAATVYAKPTVTRTYTATSTSGAGCTRTNTSTLTVTPSWTGATNTNWGTSTNWSSNAVPGPSDDVTIPVVSNLPIINEDPATPATCHNITIKNNASVTVAPGKAFNVSGTVTNSATPGIIIQSDATGSGSMIFNTTSISGTMDRFISHWTDDSHGWHFLSSPVASQAIQPVFVPTDPGSAQDFYAWDEVNNQWFNSKDPSLTWVPGFDASFIPGKGYLVAYLTNVTKTFTGTFNVTNVPKSGLTNTPGPYGGDDVTPGWNLLGNPFTSALIWNNGDWLLNNVGTVAKIWTENYASYSDIDINTGGIIPATQGFMVNVTDVAGGSLTIPATARTFSTQNWYKSTGVPCIKLLAHNLAAQTAQESTVMFNNQATAGYSPAFDCRFFPGYAPQFYSVDGSEHLSTNVLPSLDNQTIIPFNFIKTTGVNYSIEATKIDNIEGQVYLTDLKLDKTQNLADNPVYTFTAAAGDNPSRFVLSFSHVGIGENTTGKNGIYSYGNNLYIVNPGVARLEVFNLTGQKLLAEEISSTVLFRKMLFVPTGYYVVRLTTGTKVVVTKVFIQS